MTPDGRCPGPREPGLEVIRKVTVYLVEVREGRPLASVQQREAVPFEYRSGQHVEQGRVFEVTRAGTRHQHDVEITPAGQLAERGREVVFAEDPPAELGRLPLHVPSRYRDVETVLLIAPARGERDGHVFGWLRVLSPEHRRVDHAGGDVEQPRVQVSSRLLVIGVQDYLGAPEGVILVLGGRRPVSHAEVRGRGLCSHTSITTLACGSVPLTGNFMQSTSALVIGTRTPVVVRQGPPTF